MNDPRYPNGKLNDDDEGVGALALTHVDGVVVVNFFKPMRWIGLPPLEAVALAVGLIKHARAIDPAVEVSLPGYQLLDNGKRIQCFKCSSISSNPTDVAMRYCGRCNVFMDAK